MTISRNAMSKQMSTGGKSKRLKITDEEQAKIEFDIMTQNLNLSPKEKAAKKKQEQAMKMKDKKMPKMNKGGMTMPKYQRGMMVEAGMPESGPKKPMTMPKKKKKVDPSLYSDPELGGGPRTPTGGPMPPSKGRAPMGKGRGRGSKMPMMNKGGKVRGCGMAKQGVRKAKMVRMKGS